MKSELDYVDFIRANPLPRIIAGLIDVIIAYAGGFVLSFFMMMEWDLLEAPMIALMVTDPLITNNFPGLVPLLQWLAMPAEENTVLMIIFIEMCAILFGPLVVFFTTTFTEGQTFGMMPFSIHVRRLDKSSTHRSWKVHIVRSILYIIEVMIFPPLPIILILVTKNRQRIGDILTKTTVMKVYDPAPRGL
jgi:uncharacterized RDD family membrane protein YckC